MPLHQLIFAALCFGTCAYALARGGAPERMVACGFLAAFVLTNLFQSPHATIYHLFEWRIALIDGLLLAIVLAVALLSTRYWGMPMASLQTVDLFGHLTKLLDPRVLPEAYFILVALVGYPMVVLLLLGTALHRRRLARLGVDFSWVSELPAVYRAGWHAHERPRE